MNAAEMEDLISRQPLGNHPLQVGGENNTVRGFNIPPVVNSYGEQTAPLKIVTNQLLGDGNSETAWYTTDPTGPDGSQNVLHNSAVYRPHLTFDANGAHLSRREPISVGRPKIVGVNAIYVPDILSPGSVALVFRPVDPRPYVVFDASAANLSTPNSKPASEPTVVFDSSAN